MIEFESLSAFTPSSCPTTAFETDISKRYHNQRRTLVVLVSESDYLIAHYIHLNASIKNDPYAHINVPDTINETPNTSSDIILSTQASCSLVMIAVPNGVAPASLL